MGKTERWVDAWKDVVAGSARGVAQITVGHPFDTLKVRLQVNSALEAATTTTTTTTTTTATTTTTTKKGPQFQGVRHCFQETIRCDGFTGLYRGASSPLAGCLVYSATLFAAWGQSQQLALSLNFLSSPDFPNDKLSNAQLIVAGILTGTIASFVESPVDLVKTTMQTHYNQNYFRSIIISSSSICSSILFLPSLSIKQFRKH